MGQLEEGENKGNLLCLAGRLQPWDSWNRGKTEENLLCLAGGLQPSEARIKNIWPYRDKAHVCGHEGGLVWPNQLNR